MGNGSIAGATTDLPCGTLSDDFSIRYRMNQNFTSGLYNFTIGGDDGIRLSIDGGSTWLISDWSDHGYRTTSSGNLYLNGNYNLVLEFYEDGGGAQSSFSYTASSEMIVPTTGNNYYTVCSGNLYDAGGSSGNYNNNWDGYTVLYPDVSGNYIQVTGTTSGETCCDYLYIYNGVGTSGTLLWSGIANSGAIPSITSTDATGALTIRFYSDGSVTGAGFDLSINCVPPPITYTCSGTFSDSGGASGNYGNNENQIWTFCPDVAGHSISMDFTFFEMEIGIDELAVYDGTSTSDPNIGAYHGGLPLLGTVNATPSNPSGCLTRIIHRFLFKFK